MTKHIRFSLDQNALPTARDTDPGVFYGILENEFVHETPAFSSERLGAAFALHTVRLLPPVCPTKVVCVGRNYVDHAKELGNPVPEEPLIFLKPPSSLIADGDKIVFPALSQHLSYEGELGVVMGRTARNVAAEEAEQYIFGFTCVNDVTARDLQKKDSQWTRGKGFDTFCPAGPWIVPFSEFDLKSARVRTTVDGQLRQDAPISEMIFPINAIIAFVSQFMTLEAGDLIATGTPPGVGTLPAGAEVAIEIPGLGVLRNSVVQGW